MTQQSSIEFLIYSYFKFDLNSKDTDMINKIIDKAYADAAGQNAFAYKNGSLTTENTQQAKNYIVTTIENFPNNKLSYRDWHTEACEEIIKIMNNKYWTFGNSQKIVNMTIKYIILVSKLLLAKHSNHKIIVLATPFLEIYSEIDFPVDRYMINALYQNKNIWNNVTMPKINAAKGKTKSNTKNWSDWDKNDYIIFVNSYHAVFKQINVFALDWEHNEWIKH